MTMDALGNIRALLLNIDKYLAVISVQTYIIRDKSNGATCVTDDLLIVNITLGSNLSKDHDHVGLSACLTGNLAVRILG